MKLFLLIALATISLASSWPVVDRLEPEQATAQQKQPIEEQLKKNTVEEPPKKDADEEQPLSLLDVQDMGSQHSGEGARNARWLWGSPWVTNWYAPTYYQPWSYYHHYHNYWW